MGSITLHYNPAIPWHSKRADAFQKGLEALQWTVTRTQSRVRINDDPAVLFGTSAFKAVEESPDWLLVDRACWGDPEYVRLGWNGRGPLADYRIPEDAAPRWIPEPEPIEPGDKVILCGDYGSNATDQRATHYKPHPADKRPHRLPIVDSFDGCKLAICGNSTVAVELKLRGVPVEMGMYNMAHLSLKRISWTQWSWEEIEQGEPIRHLFEWLTLPDTKNSPES